MFEKKTNNVSGILNLDFHRFNLYFNPNPKSDNDVELSNLVNTMVLETWTPPQDRHIKINTNVSWKDGLYTCAAIVRDSHGTNIIAHIRLGISDTVTYVEADGFHLTIEITASLNLTIVIIEGDFQAVVNCLSGNLRTSLWRI